MKLLNSTEQTMMPTIILMRRLARASVIAVSLVSIAVLAQQTAYQKGQSQLDNKNYQAAQQTFNLIAKDKGADQDAALYWLAYAQFKSKQDQKALKTIDRLSREHPQSRWLDDASALRVEIQDKGGKSVDIDNEEMKLYALDSLMNSQSEKSMKILKSIITSNSSDKIKKRALFVLSQHDNPQAFEVIASLAKDDSNADLQREAIEVLGISGMKGALASLNEVYQTTENEAVKLKVIQSYMLSDQSELIVALAKSENNPRLKSELIQMLGVMSNSAALSEIYQDPLFTDFRDQILESLAIGSGATALFQLIESEENQDLLVSAVEKLGIMGVDETGEYLANVYKQNDNKEVRGAVLQAMMIQSNAKGLIGLLETETDPDLKRQALRLISVMGSDEALEFFEDALLNDGEL
jgi:HEAT repeat protein